MKAKHENTEAEILEAAKSIFQQKGMAGSRMQEIADKAGINKAMLHYYFRSKQMLFEAVFKNAFKLLAPQLKKILDEDTDLFDKIRGFSNSYISFVIKHPYLPNFIIQELNKNPDFIDRLRAGKDFPNIRKFKLQVENNVARGVIKPISGEQLFINIMSLNILPFIASPLFKGFLDASDKEYQALMKQRKTEVAEFIINSIRL
ncbi:TetR/AcrR family transcriptional regulator [Salegentibacter sediminis]|uniref:TetR/AcrR family transcriptional regulator n=1 Tax=Salegentibacter sediminis TaxID=1930251 RepID=UPI0009BFDA12|nr:TetR/AcrR family transcriptional regulator [Salegentibacter sediminis]